MKVHIVIILGAVIGALAGFPIFFEPNEPYPMEIFAASTLRVALVGWITGLSLKKEDSWRWGAGYGLLYGFLTGLVVFLAKGGLRSMDAPFVVPSALVTGFLTGWLVARFGRRTQTG